MNNLDINNEEFLMKPKNDYVFKRIFGHVGNEEITAGLLSSILNKKVNDVKLDCNTITEKDLLDDKIGISKNYIDRCIGNLYN